MIINLIKKEIKSLFNSPIAYIVLILFLVFSGIAFFFMHSFLRVDYASLRSYFSLFPVIFSLIIPALTMGMWAEEYTRGTSELLFTLPFKEYELVLAKFTAIVVLVVLILITTIVVPFGLGFLGDFESGEILGEYVGSFFLALTYGAIGLLISALARNQISSFLVTFSVLLGFTSIGMINEFILLPGVLRDFIHFISFDYHFKSFTKGIFDSRDLMYYCVLIFLALYSNTKVLILRKWS